MINLTLTALFPFPFLNYKEKYKDPAGLNPRNIEYFACTDHFQEGTMNSFDIN